MDAINNPYQPGAGLRPPELVGRGEMIERFDVALARAERGTAERSKVIYGLRGVGKTVLLGEFKRRAEQRKWLTVKAEAIRKHDLVPDLVADLHKTLRRATRTHGRDVMDRVLRVFKSFSMTIDPSGNYSFGFEVVPESGVADTGNLDVDLAELLTQLGSAARELGVGLLVIVDEMQEVAIPTLRAFNTAIHELGQGTDPLPVIAATAGLPSLPGILADATSYTERLYDYWEIDALGEAAAADALRLPARELGVEWTEGALVGAAEFCRGYPYFIQTLGKHAWNTALAADRITAEDVVEARSAARRDIDAGLYRARWQRATAQQNQLLKAMARCGADGPSPVAEVAAMIGKSRQEISVPRSQLIAKGLVYAPAWGQLAFTVPGMDEYLLRQTD